MLGDDFSGYDVRDGCWGSQVYLEVLYLEVHVGGLMLKFSLIYLSLGERNWELSIWLMGGIKAVVVKNVGKALQWLYVI